MYTTYMLLLFHTIRLLKYLLIKFFSRMTLYIKPLTYFIGFT